MRTLGALVLAVACVALAPAMAHAGVGAGTVVSFPTTGTVGDTGLPASITLQNLNNEGEAAASNAVCIPGDLAPPCAASGPGILVAPSCTVVQAGTCKVPDPGVFAVSPTGTGRAGTACAGMAFTVTAVGSSLPGTVRFAPPAGTHVVLPGSGASCVIDFTVSVLKLPTGDQDPTRDGVQTAQATEHTQFSGTLSAGALASSNGTTVLPLPPPPPPPPPPPAPPVSQVLPATADSARLTGKTGCQVKTFRAEVKGSQIAKVVFTLDGKAVATLLKPNRGARFSVLVRPKNLNRGRHRIRARVTFATSSTSPQTLRFVFVRCGRGSTAPRFTG